jgi:hypothetical protein
MQGVSEVPHCWASALTVGEEEPAAEQDAGEDGLLVLLLVRDGRVEHVGPVLRCEHLAHARSQRLAAEYLAQPAHLVHAEEAVVDLLEVGLDVLAVLLLRNVAAQQLHGDKRCQTDAEQQKQDHVGETGEVAEHLAQQRLHARHSSDDAVEARELERREPVVRARALDAWDLDDGRDDGEQQVDAVALLGKEAAPVAVEDKGDPAHHDLDVERDGEGQLDRVCAGTGSARRRDMRWACGCSPSFVLS